MLDSGLSGLGSSTGWGHCNNCLENLGSLRVSALVNKWLESKLGHALQSYDFFICISEEKDCVI